MYKCVYEGVLNVYVCALIRTCVTMHTWQSEDNLRKSVLSFHLVELGD